MKNQVIYRNDTSTLQLIETKDNMAIFKRKNFTFVGRPYVLAKNVKFDHESSTVEWGQGIYDLDLTTAVLEFLSCTTKYDL